MGKHHVIEFDQKCTSCNGTGIYIGIGERDGAGVVCDSCKGKGHYHRKIEYDEFETLEKRDDVKRVYEVNPGICINTDPKFGGMPYSVWFSGLEFPKKSENRKYTCPAWWYQSADYDKKPDWKECNGYGGFSGCQSFFNKDECWRKFDREQENENE